MQIQDKYVCAAENDLECIKRVLAGGKLSGTADVIDEYEAALAEYFGSGYAAATSSGTSAIQTALFAVNVRAGDEVIVSPACPLMSVFPIMQAGATVVFCDTSASSFGVSIDDLSRLVTPRTKAVVEVPMWGYPTDVATLGEVLRVVKVPLILDLAHSHGTTLQGKHMSGYGDVACFSTHDRKPLATGEGGFILTNNEAYYDAVKSFAAFGNMGGVDYGLNYKLGALQAALGLNRLASLPRQLETRRRNAKSIVNGVTHSQIHEFTIVEGGVPNYYSLLLKLTMKRARAAIECLCSMGIPSDIIRYGCKPLYEYPILRRFRRACPNAERLLRSVTTIPVHPGLSESDIHYIISSMNRVRC